MHIFDEREAILDENQTPILEKPDTPFEPEREAGLVVIDNLLARATTKWTLQEKVLFLMAVSKINTIDENNEVKLNKKEVMTWFEMDLRKSSELKKMVKAVAEKSWVEFNGPRSDLWSAGFIITGGRSDKNNLYIRFGEMYLPLVKDLKSYFTKFEIQDVIGFSHLSALNLYVYLSSWFDKRYPYQNTNLKKSDIPKIFSLKKDQYWRNYGTDQAFFDWAYFERRVLKPAIEDINNSKSCDMHIDSWEKVKDGKIVLGYRFKYYFSDKQGFIAWRGVDGKLSGEKNLD